MELQNTIIDKDSDREQLGLALEMGRRIEEEYADYKTLVEALRHDEAGPNDTLYSKEDIGIVEEASNYTGSKILQLIDQRKKMASALGVELPDSASLRRIESELMKSLESLQSITEFRPGRS